jgi:hypothetical protein
MDLIWEDPPEADDKRNSNIKYREIARALRTKPGVWAMIHEVPDKPELKTSPRECAKSMVSQWKVGRAMVDMPKDEFEVVARGAKIYARYTADA